MSRFRSAPRRGFALITALIVIMLLASVLVGFNYVCRVNLEIASNAGHDAAAAAAAQAGVEIARGILGGNISSGEETGMAALLNREITAPVGEGGARTVIRIVPESAKINVNLLKDRNGAIVRRRVDQMLRLCDCLNRQYGEHAPVGYGIVPAMADWSDGDDDVTALSFVAHENEGAEDGYYRGLTPPRACKNAPFETIGELLLVRGVTPEFFNGVPPAADGRSPGVTGLRDLLTVYGDGAIDLNYAPWEVIRSLSETMDDATAQEIVRRRTLAPFGSDTELRDAFALAGVSSAALREMIAGGRSGDRYFTVIARGWSDECERQARAVLKRTRAGEVTLVVFNWE